MCVLLVSLSSYHICPIFGELLSIQVAEQICNSSEKSGEDHAGRYSGTPAFSGYTVSGVISNMRPQLPLIHGQNRQFLFAFFPAIIHLAVFLAGWTVVWR